MKPDTVFIPTPVSELPENDGLNPIHTSNGMMFYDKKNGWNYQIIDDFGQECYNKHQKIDYWLKEVPLSELVEKDACDFAKKCLCECERYISIEELKEFYQQFKEERNG